MTGLNELVELFSRLPGIGKKSAMRLSYYLVKNKKSAIELSNVIKEVIEKVSTCSICGNFTTSDPCALCRASDRDRSILCIVEDSKDLQAIEDTGSYKGQYHILMGAINPLEGLTPDKLRIKELLSRIAKESFSEVLIATNPTTEGEATFLYLANALSKHNLKISRLATGIPMGGSLEYTDKLTLSKAIQSKQYI